MFGEAVRLIKGERSAYLLNTISLLLSFKHLTHPFHSLP
jgi:hypothetical protein